MIHIFVYLSMKVNTCTLSDNIWFCLGKMITSKKRFLKGWLKRSNNTEETHNLPTWYLIEVTKQLNGVEGLRSQVKGVRNGRWGPGLYTDNTVKSSATWRNSEMG